MWTGRPWLGVAALVGQVVLPKGKGGRDQARHVPRQLAHVFWNEDVRVLDIHRHGVLIADRILRSRDPEALGWMARNLPRPAVARAADKRGLHHGARSLARVLGQRA